MGTNKAEGHGITRYTVIIYSCLACASRQVCRRKTSARKPAEGPGTRAVCRRPALVRDDLEGSLYAVWVQKYGLELGGADEVIRAVLVRNGEARLLEVRSGAPCFLIHATGYLADGAPLWWEETWYRGDMYEFHNRLGPMPGARSVTGALR